MLHTRITIKCQLEQILMSKRHLCCSIGLFCLRTALSLHPRPHPGASPFNLGLLGTVQRGIMQRAPTLQTRESALVNSSCSCASSPGPPPALGLSRRRLLPSFAWVLGTNKGSPEAEICAWGCGPAPFPKVFTGKSRHLHLHQDSGSSACGCCAAAHGLRQD